MSTTPAQDKVTAYGLEQVCEDIANTVPLTNIAQKIGVADGTLLTWMDRPENSARTKEARRVTAKLWEERAEQVLLDAGKDVPRDRLCYGQELNFELAKAKELAHHYRWRAKMIAPREYGDGVTLRGDKDNPIPVESTGRYDLTREQLLSIAAGAAKKPEGEA